MSDHNRPPMLAADPYLVAGNIRRNLHTLTDHYEDALTGARAADAGRGGRQDSGEPLSLHAVDIRNAALTDLRYWTRFILDEVNSGTITNRLVQDNTEALASFVNTWALAVAEQLPDDATNLERDTYRHGEALKALARGWASKRMKVADRCPEVLLTISPEGVEELNPCPGELWSMFREEDNGLLPRQVTCDNDPGHLWQPNEWLALGRRLGRSIEGIA